MIWRTRTRTFDLARRGAVMGVLNVTPDSFSDGGLWVDVTAAVAHGAEMVAQGAEIVDVGGESTRPGAAPVPEAEELRRVLPVVERLSRLPGHGERFVISIDTMKPGVARQAMAAGASIINDVTGMRDGAMLATAKETAAGVVIMHMQGEPQTMQTAPRYSDVVREVREFLCASLARCLECGVPATSVAIDPGIGFGKTVEHNLQLLRHLPELRVAASDGVENERERPLLIGVSRKSFIGKVIQSAAVEDRSWPTVALTSFCRERGARVFRVHEVKPNLEALRMTEAILAQ
jgi:dihydropteroate synthase